MRFLLKAGYKDRLPGGKADKRKPSDFDAGQLARGTKHELEHTKDRALAREIAMDHLAEDPDYYSKLDLIEKARALPVGTVRKRADGTYIKRGKGKWEKVKKEHEAGEVWAARLRNETKGLSQTDRDAWVGEQFRRAKKPIAHLLYACRKILGNVERLHEVPRTGFKGLCRAIIEKAYEHGPSGMEHEALDRFNQAFRTMMEQKQGATVPLRKALSMAHTRPFFRDHPKWFDYCVRRMALKNDGEVNMAGVESYMRNAMRVHKKPPSIDYDE